MSLYWLWLHFKLLFKLMFRQWRFFSVYLKGSDFLKLLLQNILSLPGDVTTLPVAGFYFPQKMSKWLQFNKISFGEQINFHFDDKWNFPFHLIICKSFGGAEAAGCVSQKTFFLQVRLASVCSHDCTSPDMFPLLCLSGHKFETSYSSGAASPWGKWALSPAELCPSPIPFPSSGATDILPLSAAALGGNPH